MNDYITKEKIKGKVLFHHYIDSVSFILGAKIQTVSQSVAFEYVILFCMCLKFIKYIKSSAMIHVWCSTIHPQLMDLF